MNCTEPRYAVETKKAEMAWPMKLGMAPLGTASRSRWTTAMAAKATAMTRVRNRVLSMGGTAFWYARRTKLGTSP